MGSREHHLSIDLSWLVESIGGGHSVVEGNLTVTRVDEGDWELVVKAGAKGGGGLSRPTELVQMPLDAVPAALLVRALSGERVGAVDLRSSSPDEAISRTSSPTAGSLQATRVSPGAGKGAPVG